MVVLADEERLAREGPSGADGACWSPESVAVVGMGARYGSSVSR